MDCSVHTSVMFYSWRIYKEEENKNIKLKSFDWEKNTLTGKDQEFLVLKSETIIDLLPGTYYLEVTGMYLEKRFNEYSH